MSYAAIEASAYQGEPRELFRFVLGARKWLYTSGQHEEIHNVSERYQPITITRGAIEQGTELARAPLDVRLARDAEILTEFIASPPEGVMTLTLYRRHPADAETVTIWKGRVISMRLSGSEAALKCEPTATSLLRPGLRARYSLGCRHPLYSAGCGVDQEDYRADGTVAAISGTTLTIAAAAGEANGYWVAGKLVTSVGKRLITGHSGSAITIVAPLPGLGIGDPATLYAGCDHALATCGSKFANLDNYGGYPWMPTKNPFRGDGIA